MDIDSIIKRMRMQSNSISQNMKVNCEICNDSTWVKSGGAFKRCKCFEIELTRSRWKNFGVDPSKCKKINEYVANNNVRKKAKEIAINYIKNFKAVSNGEENGLAFLGQPGAGKSHLVIGIGSALINEGICTDVVYMPYVEAMKQMKANAMDEGQYSRITEQYLKCKLLIIDDLFKDKLEKGRVIGNLSESDVKHIYPIINQRYMCNLPIIYSSECDANMLRDLDEALAGRILERSSIVIFKKCIENDYRMRKFVGESK